MTTETTPFDPTPEALAARYGQLVARCQAAATRNAPRSRAHYEAHAQVVLIERTMMPLLAGLPAVPAGSAIVAPYRRELWETYTAARIAEARALREEAGRRRKEAGGKLAPERTYGR